MVATQTDRQISVASPLGDDVLLFRRMRGTEQLGRLFRYDLEVLSETGSIALNELLGKSLTVTLALPDGSNRYFNGCVSQLSRAGMVGNLYAYHVTLRPTLWLLSRNADCRIYQNITVPDIVKDVLGRAGFVEFEQVLSGEYREWEYNVQYRESDFAYVSRLLEQEGIYYYFRHEQSRHVLVLSDPESVHDPIEGCESLPYLPPDDRVVAQTDRVMEWSVHQELQPCNFALVDFDFTRPRTDLKASSAAIQDHDHANFEVFDYPGVYFDRGDGEAYARRRMEERQSKQQRMFGQTNARGLYPGGLFSLCEHPLDDLNCQYLVVGTNHELVANEYESSNQSDELTYTCNFDVVEGKCHFRPDRTTDCPLVSGPQTAIVVGPDDEEIWTDEYGRVKVQFHWDRYGQSNDGSSCWVRVSQAWAGNRWGGIQLPRIGQEVIVEFLEGNPDRPIITGRVYNGDNMPPYELPGAKTQSGIKSRSSKEGSTPNFNEIRFEDAIGSEEVYIHAEKDQSIVVENDKTEDVGHDNTETVGNDETISIGNNRTETVGANEDTTIGANRTEKVVSNESMDVGGNRTRTVAQNEVVTVTLTRTHSVGVNEMINVGAAQEVTVGGLQAVTVGATRALTVGVSQNTNVGTSHSESVGTDHTETIGKDHTAKVGKNQSSTVGDNRTVSVGKDDSLTVGKNLVIDAGDSVVIKTGKASITMKKDGTITIEGKDITVKGSGKIDAKASKNITMKGKKILQN